jgi:transposase
VPAGRTKTFRRYDPTQQFLLSPSIDDWLPEGHEARFIAEAVDELVDLDPIYAAYVVADGAPPYDPKMMLKLLLWGYSCGVTSSREMERRCATDVAFRFLSANQAPDYRSISRFRRRHLCALEDLFIQVLALCAGVGLVKLGRVALDGTKLRASASRHKAMSYDRLGPRIEEYETQVKDLLAEAEAVDQAEDDTFGEDRRGDEIADELQRKETRLQKMRAAKEAIEADARKKAAARAAQRAHEAGKSDDEVHHAAERAAKKAKPEGRAQSNFTDPESRMMSRITEIPRSRSPKFPSWPWGGASWLECRSAFGDRLLSGDLCDGWGLAAPARASDPVRVRCRVCPLLGDLPPPCRLSVCSGVDHELAGRDLHTAFDAVVHDPLFAPE